MAGLPTTAALSMWVGAATLALGWYPHAVGAIGAVPVVGGFLLDVIATSTDAPTWVREISPFAHLAAVPDTGPNMLVSVVLTAIAAATTALGMLGSAHRDLHD